MKTMKTDELTGAALDWAVSVAIGDYSPVKAYSTDWAHGGPIMEREGIDCTFHPGPTVHWTAMHVEYNGECPAPTLLEAAMRMYVYMKLGDEVVLPKELVDPVTIVGMAVGRCEFCGYICEWDEIPTAGDPTCSDGTVQCCPECNEGESFARYYLTKERG